MHTLKSSVVTQSGSLYRFCTEHGGCFCGGQLSQGGGGGQVPLMIFTAPPPPEKCMLLTLYNLGHNNHSKGEVTDACTYGWKATRTSAEAPGRSPSKNPCSVRTCS